jgi:hypothetical protein
VHGIQAAWREGTTARRLIDGVTVIGYERGIFVRATAERVRADLNRVEMSPDDTQGVVKLFNDQVT